MAYQPLRPCDLPYRITFERKVRAAGVMSAGNATWEQVAEVYAGVQDVLPSRSEKVAEGINMAAHPARIRVRYRPGLNAEMRIRHGDRLMQIVSGPAEMGFRDGMEFMAEDYSTQGGGR